LDPRCDQFAWGLVAYEALAGRLPWSHEGGGMAYLAALASTPAPPLATIDGSSLQIVQSGLIRFPRGMSSSSVSTGSAPAPKPHADLTVDLLCRAPAPLPVKSKQIGREPLRECAEISVF